MSHLRRAAEGQACSNCGRQDETVVLAHYSGIRQYSFGKGRGIKGDDYAAAPQCAECHRTGPFSEGYVSPGFSEDSQYARQAAKSEEQMFQILMWHMRRGFHGN